MSRIKSLAGSLLLLLTAALAGMPAFAQTDFSGEWTRVQEEDSSLNPDLGDWVGLTLKDRKSGV